jgi:hypothetical protein
MRRATGQCATWLPKTSRLGSGRQVNLNDHPASLAALDRALDQRRDEAMSVLENEAGLYLCTAMVRNLRDTRWHVWPNGHPVVQLSSGRTFDVVALVNQQASIGRVHLADLYADAARADGNVDNPELP